MSFIKSRSLILLRVCMLALLGACMPFAVACSNPVSVAPAPTTVEHRIEIPTSMPTPTSAPKQNPIFTPTGTPSGIDRSSNLSVIDPPLRLVPDSLDQYIFSADVIVRASLLSAVAAVEGAGTAFRPANNLRFRAIGYLKGTGAAEFTVQVSPPAYEATYGTREEAQGAAEAQLASRNSAWDDREGALFLKTTGVSGAASASTPTFNFVWLATSSPLEYTIDTIARTWLPAVGAPGAGGQSDADIRYLTSAGESQVGGASGGARAMSVSLADLRSQIAAMDALLDKGSGIEGYRDCIAHQLAQETYKREYLAKTGTALKNLLFEHRIASGLAAGTSISSQPEEYTYAQSPRYSRFWVEGVDKAHFAAGVLDDDQDPTNGWFYYERTTRPLPTGTYLVAVHFVHYTDMPCNYDAGSRFLNRLVVTAPEGTVHEAFFDPVTIGSAIGADGANGALKPAAFTANGTSTSLQSLKWHSSGIITLTLSPNASLSGLALDFIALDGTVALALPASAAKTDSSTGTVTWSSATAPWKAGDKLMLRIRNAAATTAPTPTATATPTATPTPVPPPGPVSGQ